MPNRPLGTSVQPISSQEDVLPSALRPKRLPLRAARWTEEQGVWRASLGEWAAQVGPSVERPGQWEWRAFSTPPGAGSLALGGGSWGERLEAQADAEAAIGDFD